LALHNLASLPHISIAGAVATATHGSGVANGNLATAVAGLELVTSSGETVTAVRGDADFEGLVVGLGALGAVTRITLDVRPDYEVRQRVFEDLPWEALFEHLDAITSAAYSVSVFTRWGEAVDMVWLKSLVTGAPESVRGELFGATAATVDRHPIPGLDPVHSTPQLGRQGRWSARLPHVRMGFTPSSGEELQSEYHVPFARGLAAIDAVAAIREQVAPVLQVCEIRTIAADDLWLSPNYHQDSLALHFTWIADTDAVLPVVGALEAQLDVLGARPHWGKVFTTTPDTLRTRFERLGDFAALARQFDPAGTLRNPWLDNILGS
jgi:xylitol oxidase